ncbi:uncharacterized protein [Magallana gigas]|uniref:uncharacterized protein n=1 Tax=Magallana gigas TaxID=29159 RepID=UPI003341DD86
MSVRIPGLRAGVLLALCLCVCVNQGLKLKDSSQLVYPIPRHRLWDNSRTVGLEQTMCIETKDTKCGYCSKIPLQVRSKPLISYLPGALIEIKSHVNSTAGGILRVSLCSRSDSFRSEEEDCRYDMPLVELNSNSRDILLNPSKEVTKSFLLPEEFVCTHCVLQWRFTEVDPSCNGCLQTTINCADISITDGEPYANHVRKKRQTGRVDRRFIVHSGGSDTWNRGATQSHWSQQRRGQSWSIPPRQTGAIQPKQQLPPAHMPRTNLQNTQPNRNMQKFQQNQARNVRVQGQQQMSPNRNAFPSGSQMSPNRNASPTGSQMSPNRNISPTGSQNFFDPIAQFRKKQTSSASQFRRGFQQPGLPNGLLVKNRQLHQNQHKQGVNSKLHANVPTVNSVQGEKNKLNQIQQMFRTGRGGVPQTREFVANGIKRVQTVRIPIERERVFNPNIIDPKYLVVNENEPAQSNQPLIQQVPKVEQATAKPVTTAKPKATTSQPTAAPMPPATTIKPKKMANDNYENSHNSSTGDHRKGRTNDKGDEYGSDI